MRPEQSPAPATLPSEVTGHGRPLVLVPGGLTGWISWIPIAERLAATRTVVRVQLLNVQRGLDGQDLPAGYSPETEKTALGATLETLGLTPPVDVAAWSYGGAVALAFALDRPHWVRTLTLVEPDAPWAQPALDAEAQRVRAHDLRLSREHVTDEDLEQFLLEAGLVPMGTNPRDLPQWPTWSRHRQSLRAVPSSWEYEGDRRRLGGFPRPVLLVKGTGSAPYLHRTVDELAEQLPDAAVAELPGGHAPHLVSTESFLHRMRSLHEEAETAAPGRGG